MQIIQLDGFHRIANFGNLYVDYIICMRVHVCMCGADRVEDDSRSAGKYETLAGPATEISFRNGKATQQGS
jgi:hypothetical protein